LLVPADHPTLRPEAVQQLLAERAARTERSIFIPTHAGRRGHPALIGWRHVAGIRASPAGEGLNAYLRRHAAETCEVAMPWPDVLLDLDTPEDYERCCREWG
jgi:CTP:molybdopterin cytidylyltransferase MocA